MLRWQSDKNPLIAVMQRWENLRTECEVKKRRIPLICMYISCQSVFVTVSEMLFWLEFNAQHPESKKLVLAAAHLW
jgi:hypothetical protein